ncbi:MAG: Flp family type IVb pilin [Elusimicrobiota bacterium]|jgi:Flp pilus assembly pilin Flp
MSRLKSNRGQGLVEYVLVLVLMALLAIGSLKFLGQKTHNAFAQAGQALNTQMDYSKSMAQEKGEVGD